MEPAWLGNHVAHRITCPAGHALTVRPAKRFRYKRIPCKVCRNNELEKEFVDRMADFGGVLLEPYKGSQVQHRFRCPEGHDGQQTPAHLAAGHSLCRLCSYAKWDVFYVVLNELDDVVKFGVTSGNGKVRIAAHRGDGFDRVVRLHTGLPDGVAPKLERMIVAALRDAKEQPVRGREYFPSHVLPLVLDVIDNHPAIRL